MASKNNYKFRVNSYDRKLRRRVDKYFLTRWGVDRYAKTLSSYSLILFDGRMENLITIKKRGKRE